MFASSNKGEPIKSKWNLDFCVKDQKDLFEDLLYICERRYSNLKNIVGKIIKLLNNTYNMIKSIITLNN